MAKPPQLQSSRSTVKLSSVCLTKKGMLSLDSRKSPVTNYLPNTAKLGDRGSSWGSNRMQEHVLNQQINIFTPLQN